MLTVGMLKKIIEEENIPDDTIICVPIDSSNINSINIRVNVVSITPKENSYGYENLLTFVASPKHEELAVRKLVSIGGKWAEIIRKF